MNAILIDSKHRSIQYIDLENDTVECLGQAIDEEHILPVPCDEALLQKHFLITDEVPYLKEEQTVYGAFTVKGFDAKDYVYNKAIIVGPPTNGRFTDCTLPLEALSDRIQFETEHNAKEYHRIARTLDMSRWDIKL